ncbi:MAG: lactate utilization protein [Eubacteriales bacterium]|nr:lactate utilization protein [Eubacteriales bacterium]MDD3349585.1 lactate utilization protein [Eubacteriales bacterium]
MNKTTENTIAQLKRNGFGVSFYVTAAEALDALLAQIPSTASIGFGGSMTVNDMRIYEAFKEKGNAVFWHWYTNPGESRKDILRSAATASVYFSGINAITEEGSLVNIDGTGNRLSGILYGHDKVFLVAGMNKIVRNYEEAILRIKNVACPPNARRLGRKTPCAETGKCMNCNSPDRICMATLILDRQPAGVPIEIILIDESLGY